MDTLVYNENSDVIIGSNRFINVPIILQYDDIDLISVVKEEKLGFTTLIPIYHPDGTYLAKVHGTRVYKTEEGNSAGINVRKLPDMWVCELEGRPIFEIKHKRGDAFRTTAELHTNTGQFVKFSDVESPVLFDPSKDAIKMPGLTLTGTTFSNMPIGIRITSGGSIALG